MDGNTQSVELTSNIFTMNHKRNDLHEIINDSKQSHWSELRYNIYVLFTDI